MKLLESTVSLQVQRDLSEFVIRAYWIQFNDRRVSKDQPRLFISISGEPFLSLSGKYSLEVELYYHAEHGFQPITFRDYQSPIDVVAGDQCQYRFFKEDGTVAPEYAVEPFPDRAPKEVSVENGFSSISPGERITRSIAIDAKSCYELESGIEYKLQLPRGQITWWGAGSLEVSFGTSPTYQCS
jgi:hypothetical protein